MCSTYWILRVAWFLNFFHYPAFWKETQPTRIWMYFPLLFENVGRHWICWDLKNQLFPLLNHSYHNKKKIFLWHTTLGIINVDFNATGQLLIIFEGCLTMHLLHEIKWNANLMQLGNFIDVLLTRHVLGTYAHHQEHYAAALKTTNHPKTRVCKNLFINSMEEF